MTDRPAPTATVPDPLQGTPGDAPGGSPMAAAEGGRHDACQSHHDVPSSVPEEPP